MNEKIIETVKQSHGHCLMKGDFVGRFYEIFLASHQDIPKLFAKTDMVEQKKLLRHGINCIILYAQESITGKSCLGRIRKTHSKDKMDIKPFYYQFWFDSLIKTISEFDHKFNDEVESAWKEVIQYGIQYISDGYKVSV